MNVLHRTLITLLLVSAASPDALADAKAGEKKAQLCLSCHKPAHAAVPLLDGQRESYLVGAITAYKTGQRSDSAMQMRPNVASFSARDIADVAAWFASRPAIPGAYPTDEVKSAAGGKSVQDASCASCHGATFAGEGVSPRLAGQSPLYLAQQLEAFAAARRAHPEAKVLFGAPMEFEAVAHYLASLK
jgi:cytochrome c553